MIFLCGSNHNLQSLFIPFNRSVPTHQMEPISLGAFVESFLDQEKDDTRRLLQLQMESLLDPMVESLFGQLKAKFVDYVAAAAVCGDDQEEEEPEVIQYQQQPMMIDRKSNQFGVHLDNAIGDSIGKAQIITPQIILIKDDDDDDNDDNDNNDPSNVSQFNEDSSLEVQLYPESSLIPSTSSNESASLNAQQVNHHHQPESSYDYQYDYEDEEDECDCDDCINAPIYHTKSEMMDHSDDDHDDDSSSLDHHIAPSSSSTMMNQNRSNDASFKPVNNSKKRILHSNRDSQPSSKKQRSEETQFTTLSVKCYQPNCREQFTTKELLDDHLLRRHKIRRFKCLFEHCPYSCDNNLVLSGHIRAKHPQPTKWHCVHCPPARPKYFNTMHNLAIHLKHYHQEGRFRCSYPSCGFTGDTRGALYCHYKQQHQNLGFACAFEGCTMVFTSTANLKSHERTHLGIEPYRCKYPGCCYASVARANTINHIRRVHLQTPLTKRERLQRNVVETVDPRDYLEVVKDLL